MSQQSSSSKNPTEENQMVSRVVVEKVEELHSPGSVRR